MNELRRPVVAPSIIGSTNRVKNACTECKRRKVKCDGTEPCFYCRWYKHPERCAYPQPAPRPSLTRKSLDTLRSRLANSTDVLKRLFPTSTLDDLVPLSREALLALLDNDQSGNHSPTATPTAAVAAPASSTDINISQSPEGSRGSRDFEYNESIENLEETEAVADDVNALFLKPDRTSSYVGASSATAGLRTLLKIAPDLRFIKPKLPHRANSQESNNNLRADPSQVIERSGESRAPRDLRSLVDAYFWHVHSSTPILDEFQFRTTFESRERKDPTWFALLHMVCALGTIAHTTSDSNEDIYHYKIAKSYLSLDSFGSGHIDTLQALILMAGWYLHYRNRPNMASALMGAVFRMAHALGLHKELPGNETARDKHQRELRRRIWWSLVVLDTGEGTTLGRVSKTELFNSEVKLPRNINDHYDTQTGEIITGPTVYSMLLADIEFSRHASKIQERLISSPCLEFNETLALDAHLVYWFESIPFLNNPELLPECLQQPRLSTKWKYQNLRIILHRPTLMEATLRHIPFQELQGEQKVCVRKCQSLAGKAIENIASEWTQNQYSGWPAVWFLFQACTIPLLSLYGFNDDLENAEGWKKQVERAIKLFEEMKPWSIAAHQTHVFVSLLYEAYHQSQGAPSNPNFVENTPTLFPAMESSMNAIVAATGRELQHQQQQYQQQQQQQQLQNMMMMEWPSWEGLATYPDLMPSVPIFPDLNFPDLGPVMSSWDFPTEAEAGGETLDVSLRHSIQHDSRVSRRGDGLDGNSPRRRPC